MPDSWILKPLPDDVVLQGLLKSSSSSCCSTTESQLTQRQPAQTSTKAQRLTRTLLTRRPRSMFVPAAEILYECENREDDDEMAFQSAFLRSFRLFASASSSPRYLMSKNRRVLEDQGGLENRAGHRFMTPKINTSPPQISNHLQRPQTGLASHRQAEERGCESAGVSRRFMVFLEMLSTPTVETEEGFLEIFAHAPGFPEQFRVKAPLQKIHASRQARMYFELEYHAIRWIIEHGSSRGSRKSPKYQRYEAFACSAANSRISLSNPAPCFPNLQFCKVCWHQRAAVELQSPRPFHDVPQRLPGDPGSATGF